MNDTPAIVFPDPLPQWVRQTRRRRAECRVYDALRSQLSAPWRVFYSRPWLGLDQDGRERDGEADFVLIHPQLGMLVLEVKGGRIERNGQTEQWYSIDGDEIRHRIANPAQQAVRSKHELLRLFRSLPGWNGRFITARHGIVFPDCIVPSGGLGPDFPRRLVAGIDEMDQLGEWALKRLGDAPDEKERTAAIGCDGVDLITTYFNSSFRLERPAAATLQCDEEQIRVLTDQQVQVLGMLEHLSRLAIPGPAGTGKTSLAVEKARRLARAGKKTLLLCYNRPLGCQLKLELGSEPGLTVDSFHSLCRELADRAGVLPRVAVPERASDKFRYELPAALTEAMRRKPTEKFDAVVIDEGQDFEESWYSAVESLLKDPRNGTLIVFYDDNQRVHSHEPAIARHLPPAGIRLNRIVRNAKSIVKTIDPLLPKPFDAAGPEGLEVMWIEAPGQATAAAIAEQLKAMIGEHRIQPGQIAVLVADERSRAQIVLREHIGSWPVADAEAPPRERIVCDTVRRFKGLERPVVIVHEPEAHLEHPEALYVALTRARILLCLLGSRGRLDQLDSLLGGPKTTRRIGKKQ